MFSCDALTSCQTTHLSRNDNSVLIKTTTKLNTEKLIKIEGLIVVATMLKECLPAVLLLRI